MLMAGHVSEPLPYYLEDKMRWAIGQCLNHVRAQTAHYLQACRTSHFPLFSHHPSPWQPLSEQAKKIQGVARQGCVYSHYLVLRHWFWAKQIFVLRDSLSNLGPWVSEAGLWPHSLRISLIQGLNEQFPSLTSKTLNQYFGTWAQKSVTFLIVWFCHLFLVFENQIHVLWNVTCFNAVIRLCFCS